MPRKNSDLTIGSRRPASLERHQKPDHANGRKHEPTCCYCGRAGHRICPQCLRRWQRLGYYPDDEIMLRMQEALTVADRREVREDEREADRQRRKENRARVKRRQRAAASGLGNEIEEPTAEAA